MELEKSCVDFVESLLDRDKDYFSDRNSTDTLWELFLAGIACKSELLLSHCYSAIDKNAAKFFTWLPLTEKDVSVVWLADIMRRDTLYCPEYLIYRSVIQFAEKECKRRCMETSAANCRKVLGPLFLLIRFPQMTVSEIRKGPRESGILTDREVCDLLLYIKSVEDFHIPYPKESRSWSQKSKKTHEIIRRGNGQLVYCVDSALFEPPYRAVLRVAKLLLRNSRKKQPGSKLNRELIAKSWRANSRNAYEKSKNAKKGNVSRNAKSVVNQHNLRLLLVPTSTSHLLTVANVLRSYCGKPTFPNNLLDVFWFFHLKKITTVGWFFIVCALPTFSDLNFVLYRNLLSP